MSMFDRHKAEACGLIVPCDLPTTEEPQRLAGPYYCYTCPRGHAHRVWRSDSQTHIEALGYDWRFLDAVLNAIYRASVKHDPAHEATGYALVYRATLTEHGYGHVLPEETP